MKNRKPISQKIKTILQKEIGSVCPFCQSKDVDHFEFHHIDEQPENNQITNLLMLCPTCHSKITKGDISNEEVIKTKRRVSGELKPKLPKKVEELLNKGKDNRNESKLNEARSIYGEALTLSEKLNDHFAIAKCKLALASVLNDKHEFPCEALKYIKESENYFRDNNLDENLADALYEAAIAELTTEEFDNARIHLLEAIEINQRQNDKFGEAECYHQMGWLEHGQGHLKKSKHFYRKAIEICEQEYTKHDKKLITSRIGACYTHIALVNKAEGNISEAESNLTKGLEYFRQSELPISIGQTLFFLAELKLKTQQLESGQEYLQEALKVFNEIKDFRWLAQALDLLSLIHYNFGDKQKGIEIFHAAIKAIEETDDIRNKLKYYRKLAELYKIEQKYEAAENLYLQIVDLSAKESIDDEYFRAVMGIVLLKKKQDKPKERNEFARKGIDKLKQVLIKTQRESKRAQTLGDIAALYTESENYIEAKKYFLLAKDAYISLSNKNGVAECIGALAYIYHLEGDYQKESEANKELKDLTEGTHHYFAQAAAVFNLCVYEIDDCYHNIANLFLMLRNIITSQTKLSFPLCNLE
jgi:tetratricopeptide (TPR) repeat protein